MGGFIFCAAGGRAYLWVADPLQVTFLCLSKEKSPKETTPRSRRILLALLARLGARLTRRARTTRLGLNQNLATPPMRAAMLSGGYGVFIKHQVFRFPA